MWTLIKDAFGIISFFKTFFNTRVFVAGVQHPNGTETIIQLERYRVIKLALTAKPYDECKHKLKVLELKG